MSCDPSPWKAVADTGCAPEYSDKILDIVSMGNPTPVSLALKVGGDNSPCPIEVLFARQNSGCDRDVLEHADPHAALALGLAYLNGIGIEKAAPDIGRAMLRLALHFAGDEDAAVKARALIHLGQCAEYGIGGRRDLTLAGQCYEEAGRLKSPQAASAQDHLRRYSLDPAA